MSRVLGLTIVSLLSLASLALPTLAAPQTPDVIGRCLPSVSQAEGNQGSGRATILSSTCALADVADLAVGISDAPDPTSPDTNLTYAITAQNLGPSPAADATPTDVLPAGTTFVSFSAPAGWACTFPEIGTSGTLTCAIGTFPVSSATFTVVVHVAPSVAFGTTLHNTVTFSSATADPSMANNSATADTTVGPSTATPTPTSTGTPTPTATPTASVTPTGGVPTVAATSTATVTATATVTSTPTPFTVKTSKDDTDKAERQTDLHQIQQDHTNQAGRDDYHTEGGIVEVGMNGNQPYAVIGTRDGPVTVLLNCEPGCPAIQVGDYVQVDGVKETEQRFEAENITVTRDGRAVH